MGTCVEVPMARIKEVSNRFDNLVDLMPAKIYLDAEEVINLRHMKKSERVSTKEAFKQQHKLAKQAKLDPDTDLSTTAIQRSREEQQAAASTSGRQVPALHANPLGSASKEELQARLQERIQAMREKRKADERAQTANKAKQWKQQQHQKGRQKPAKRPRESESAHAEAASQQTPSKPADKPAATGKAGKHQDEVMFSKLHVQEGQPAHKKAKKQSKQQLLREAEAKTGNDNDAGAEAPQWDKYMRLAQGDKVLDNPALLRKALKKEGKAKSKKATAWQMRNKTTAEKQQARQQKRQTNLQKRVDTKKANKIAKREKKLMRPGFEGRATSLPKMSS